MIRLCLLVLCFTTFRKERQLTKAKGKRQTSFWDGNQLAFLCFGKQNSTVKNNFGKQKSTVKNDLVKHKSTVKNSLVIFLKLAKAMIISEGSYLCKPFGLVLTPLAASGGETAPQRLSFSVEF